MGDLDQVTSYLPISVFSKVQLEKYLVTCLENNLGTRFVKETGHIFFFHSVNFMTLRYHGVLGLQIIMKSKVTLCFQSVKKNQNQLKTDQKVTLTQRRYPHYMRSALFIFVWGVVGRKEWFQKPSWSPVVEDRRHYRRNRDKRRQGRWQMGTGWMPVLQMNSVFRRLVGF